jgi:shikimate dehydrogenase
MIRYGIIGYPLVQSFSQPYFRAKFEKENIIDTDYEKFPIESIQLFPAILAQNKDLAGLNVTIPYKESILQYIDDISDVVKKCGATNCIKIENGKLTAYNTDVIGFERSFTPLLKSHHTKALILGTGGAAKAVAYVLNSLSIPFLFVSRQSQNAGCITYEMVTKELLQDYNIIINASPSGMIPNEDSFPLLPYEFITPKHLLYDLVYKPEETIFLKKGKEQGAAIKNGFEMLILQAEAAWEIWNNKV